jgi:hypothetical protein
VYVQVVLPSRPIGGPASLGLPLDAPPSSPLEEPLDEDPLVEPLLEEPLLEEPLLEEVPPEDVPPLVEPLDELPLVDPPLVDPPLELPLPDDDVPDAPPDDPLPDESPLSVPAESPQPLAPAPIASSPRATTSTCPLRRRRLIFVIPPLVAARDTATNVPGAGPLRSPETARRRAGGVDSSAVTGFPSAVRARNRYSARIGVSITCFGRPAPARRAPVDVGRSPGTDRRPDT